MWFKLMPLWAKIVFYLGVFDVLLIIIIISAFVLLIIEPT